jgi:gamma-carbonic anhydrase
MYAGIPAKRIKEVWEDMNTVIARTAKNYPMYAEWYKE